MNLLPSASEIAMRECARLFFSDPTRAQSWSALCRSGLLLRSMSGTAPMRPRTEVTVLLEEAGRGLATPAIAANLAACLALEPLDAGGWGNRFARELMYGEGSVCIALQDASGAWPPRTAAVQARRTSEGWCLSGDAHWVVGHDLASHCLVALSLHEDGKPAKPALAVIGMSSISSATQVGESLDGEEIHQLHFDDVCISPQWVVCEGEPARLAVEELAARLSVFHAAEMIGAATAVLEGTLRHCNEREAFGQPIGEFQVVRHQCAEMRIWLDAASLLAAEATWLQSVGAPFTVQCSQAKAFANEKCLAVTRLGQQLHGACAFMESHPLHRWHRRVAALGMRCGTVGEHRAVVASALLD